jgi:glyceraldehyde 3-phosphate dehydrogenase
LKILLETPGLQLIAANEIASADNVVYLLKYDSVYGRYDKPVATGDGTLMVGQHGLALLHEKNPANLPWRSLNVEIVFECTGVFTRRDMLAQHVQAPSVHLTPQFTSVDDTISSNAITLFRLRPN